MMLVGVICNLDVFTSRKEKKLAIASGYWWFFKASNNPFFQVLLHFDTFEINVQSRKDINQGPYYARTRQFITAILLSMF